MFLFFSSHSTIPFTFCRNCFFLFLKSGLSVLGQNIYIFSVKALFFSNCTCSSSKWFNLYYIFETHRIDYITIHVLCYGVLGTHWKCWGTWISRTTGEKLNAKTKCGISNLLKPIYTCN